VLQPTILITLKICLQTLAIERKCGSEDDLFLQISSESAAIGFNIILSPGRIIVKSILVGDRLIHRSEFDREFNRSVEEDLDFILRSTTGYDVRNFVKKEIK